MTPLPFALLFLLLAHAASADVGHEEVLPPLAPWHGPSEELQAAPDDPWATPGERTGLTDSPSYEETVAWLQQLVRAAGELQMLPLGRSPQGRTIWMVVASREGAATPQGVAANGRPTVLVQAGIHSGEIDGKDAGMMLLRDMTVAERRGDLLDGANLLFIPILSVDAHEMGGPHARINQRGPRVQGWRANARNLNLNRDYAKLDTPELRAVVAVLSEWPVDLYVDIHVTDGLDYRYDITYGFNGPHGWSPAIGAWLQGSLRPRVDADLREAGHLPSDLIFAGNGRDLRQGAAGWTAGIRFSNGYGDARHLPTILVENHSLKDFRRRVLGTRVLLESLLRAAADEQAALRAAVQEDRARRAEEIAADWEVPEGPAPRWHDFLGVASERVFSPITGDSVVRWTGEARTFAVEYRVPTEPKTRLRRPRAYWVPAAWPEVVERLRRHGLRLETLAAPRTLEVVMDRLSAVELADRAYEGHVRVAASFRPERRTLTLAPGSVRVPTDQPLGTLSVLLLDPRSPDSFFQWGFFPECLQRTEYFEDYVLEPMARRMLDEDRALAEAFRRRLAEDPDFAADPRARLEWFYRKTPYYDPRHLLYPVAREP